MQREDGKIEPMDERLAYQVLHPNGNNRQPWKVIGVCDAQMWGSTPDSQTLCGLKYIEEYKKGIVAVKQDTSLLAGLKSMRDRYFASVEKLMFEDFLDAKDERVVRGNAQIDKLNAQITAIEEKNGNAVGQVHEKALAAQLEQCRGNIEYPDPFRANVIVQNNPEFGDTEKIVRGNINM